MSLNEGQTGNFAGNPSFDSNMTAADYADDENYDQSLQQDIAAAAARAAGINVNYNPENFDPGGVDTFGFSNRDAVTGILDSYFDDPSRTGMAIRESFPMFKSPKSGLDQFVNLYTSRRGPISRADSISLYDRNRSNPGGVDTSGYDSVKAAQRLGIGSGQVKTDPNVGRLTGQVFGKKNALGETVLMSDGKSMGIDAADYYSGKSGSEVGRSDLETYQDKYGYADPTERAINRAYDQYLNPYNDPNLPGYNRDIDPNVNPQAFDLRGQVRPGLQSGIFSRRDGTPTVLGPIATYDRNYSGMDNIAMGVTGGMGYLARALTNKVTGIAGQPLPQDAMAPTPEMIARGETYGGLGRSFAQIPGQAVQGFKDAGSALQNVIDDFTTPNVPGVSTSSLDFMPRGASPDLAGFEQRFGGTNPLSGETSISSVPSSSVVSSEPRTFVRNRENITGNFNDLSPEQQKAANDAGVAARTEAINSGLGVSKANQAQRRARNNTAIDFLRDIQNAADDEMGDIGVMLSGYTPNEFSGVNFNAPAEEQLALIDTIGAAFGRNSVQLDSSTQDFLDKYGMSIQDLMDKNFENIPNGAVLPSGQIMSDELRPEKSSFVPAPDIMQQIRNATAARELGGPLTANQLAGTLEYVLPGKGYSGSRTYVPGGNSTPVFGNERFSGEGIMNTIKDYMVPDFIEDYFNQRGMRQRRRTG